jgi:hypothetical protein
MKTYWLSSKKMTVSVDVDDKNVIIDGAPIINVFKGQPLTNLANWMKKHGGFRIKKISDTSL